MKTISKKIKIIGVVLITFVFLFTVRFINTKLFYQYDFEDIYGIETNYPIVSELGEIKKVNFKRVQGYHFQPKNKKSKGVIITFGGSEGSSLYPLAKKLYTEGCEVLSLYYFGKVNQNKEIVEVDLDFFGEVLKYLENNSIDASIISVIGFSKGAELSLVLTQYYSEIDNVILYAPTAFIYQGGNKDKSPWSSKGKNLSYLRYNKVPISDKIKVLFGRLINVPISYLDMHEKLSENLDERSDEWIYKKKIKGKILIFAGNKDKVWPSWKHAKKLKNYDSKHVELYIFKNAGHLFSKYEYLQGMKLGGERESNLKAKKDSFNILKNRLYIWHKIKK